MGFIHVYLKITHQGSYVKIRLMRSLKLSNVNYNCHLSLVTFFEKMLLTALLYLDRRLQNKAKRPA